MTMIDQGDSFVFGYSKLDVMFGRRTADEVRIPYSEFAKPGVRLLRETVAAIDPEARRSPPSRACTRPTSSSSPSAPTTTSRRRRGWPRRATSSTRSPGAERLAELIPDFSAAGGRSASAERPSSARRRRARPPCCCTTTSSARGVRGDVRDLARDAARRRPVPPSPETSAALLDRLRRARASSFIPARRIASLDPDRAVAVLEDGSELPYDLFLGVPKHRAPDVVSGQRDDRPTATSRSTRRRSRRRSPASTRSATSPPSACRRPASSPRAPPRVVAAALIARLRGGRSRTATTVAAPATSSSAPDRVGRVDIDFLTGPEADRRLPAAVA